MSSSANDEMMIGAHSQKYFRHPPFWERLKANLILFFRPFLKVHRHSQLEILIERSKTFFSRSRERV